MSPDTLHALVAPAHSQLKRQEAFLRAALARHLAALIAEAEHTKTPTAAQALCLHLEAMGLAYVSPRTQGAVKLAMHGLEVRARTRARALEAWIAQVQAVTA